MGLPWLFLLVYYSIKLTYGELCLRLQSLYRPINTLTNLILLSQVRGTPCLVQGAVSIFLIGFYTVRESHHACFDLLVRQIKKMGGKIIERSSG